MAPSTCRPSVEHTLQRAPALAADKIAVATQLHLPVLHGGAHVSYRLNSTRTFPFTAKVVVTVKMRKTSLDGRYPDIHSPFFVTHHHLASMLERFFLEFTSG
jgi:hypothetical protein